MTIEEEPAKDTSVLDAIVAILADSGVAYTLLTHEPVYTMEQAAEVCHHAPEQGVKVMMIKVYSSKKEYTFHLVVWTGNQPLQFDALATQLGAKKVMLASPEQVQQTLGIEIGALAPFGYTQQLPVIFDQRLAMQNDVFINAGIHDKTIQISSQNLIEEIKKWSSKVTVL